MTDAPTDVMHGAYAAPTVVDDTAAPPITVPTTALNREHEPAVWHAEPRLVSSIEIGARSVAPWHAEPRPVVEPTIETLPRPLSAAPNPGSATEHSGLVTAAMPAGLPPGVMQVGLPPGAMQVGLPPGAMQVGLPSGAFDVGLAQGLPYATHEVETHACETSAATLSAPATQPQ